MIETLSTPSQNVVFEQKNRLEPFFQKRNIPINKVEYANTVYNTLSYGLNVRWNTLTSTSQQIGSYSGVVPNCKFYYGNQRPDTIINWQDTYKWSINMTNYFTCNYTGKHYFAFGGSGNIGFYIFRGATQTLATSYSMNFEDQNYHVSSVDLTQGDIYSIFILYTPEQQKEYGFVGLWKTDSASITSEYQLIGGEQFYPISYAGLGSIAFTELSHVSKTSYTENEDGKSIFTFEVPFISSSSYYNKFGYYYVSTSKTYIEKSSGQTLKEYRMIRYSEGYRNSQGEDELMTKFTGQIRKIEKKYKSNGADVLFITCYDYSVFLKDSVNLSAPTKIDYIQAGYLTNIPGYVNGNLKPRTFDGWEIYKAYEILLTEAGICGSSFYEKKKFIDFAGNATSGGYIIEPKSNTTKEYLPTNKKYGIDPIGKIDNKTDDKYAYSIGTGEYWFDAIDKIMKPWYYKWGFSPNGNPYLKTINVPNNYVNSSAFSTSANWISSVHPRAFCGDFLISNYNETCKLDTATFSYFNVSDISAAYAYGETGQQIEINCYSNWNGRPDILQRSGTTVLAFTPATDYAEFKYGIEAEYKNSSGYPDIHPTAIISIYSTSSSTTTFNASTWSFLSSTTHSDLKKYGDYYFNRQITDAGILSMKSLCFVVDLIVSTGIYEVSLHFDPEYMLYQETSIAYNKGAIASCNATGKKFALLVGVGPTLGYSDNTKNTMKVTISKDEALLSETYHNLYNSVSHFYFDGVQNDTGINPSYLFIADGLPYDEYNIKVESIDSSYPVYLEGLLAYDQDLNTPLEIFYTGDSQHKGNISKLNTTTEYENQRNEAIVIGKRLGTLFYTDSAGNEIAVNPNNETSIYVQSATRDLNSIYNASASNFVGHTRNTIITDPSIINQHQADFISYNVVNDYGSPKENANFSMVGNPKLQPGDCIAVVDDFKYGIDSSNYLWVTKVSNSFEKTYITQIETSPIKPVNSFWSVPDIDVDALFDGYYIWNLTVHNGGWSSYITVDLSTTGSYIYVSSAGVENYANTVIPPNGYCLLGREIIHYDSVDASGSSFVLKVDKRGLGESGTAYAHAINDDIIIGYNPYSKSQLPPTISFDLLRHADVEVDIWNYIDESNTMNISNITACKVDSLTNVSQSPKNPTYETKEIGHYEFYWGGFDRVGDYNDSLRTADEGSLYKTDYFARSNYKLPYYPTAYGMYYAMVKVIPRDDPDTVHKYYTQDSGASYLNTYGSKTGIIKQFLMDPGTVNLSFSTSNMYYAELEDILKIDRWGNINSDNSAAYYGNSKEIIANSQWSTSNGLIKANIYPYVFINDSVAGTFITNKSPGLSFHITSKDPYNYDDIQRIFIPSIQCYIRQFSLFTYTAKYEVTPHIQVDIKDTIIPLSEAQSLDRIMPNTELYINPKKLEQDGKLSFIPENVQENFQKMIPKVPENKHLVLLISNLIFFDNNLVDLSGRRVKQEKKIYILRDSGGYIDIFDFDINTYGGRNNNWDLSDEYLAYLLLYKNGNLPYIITPTNNGFYEYINPKGNYKWLYRYKYDPSYNISKYEQDYLHFYKKLTWEYAPHPSRLYLKTGSRTTHDTEQTNIGYFLSWKNKPKYRTSYVTWMDTDRVKRIMNMVPEDLTKIFIEDRETFYPSVWAVFTREDFA